MFSYFFGTFLVGLARAIWLLRRPETVFPADRSVKILFRSECIWLWGGGGMK